MDPRLVTQKLVEHDGRFDRIETKLETFITREEFLQHMDRMMVILQRLDQERVFTNHTVKRHEDDIQAIKKNLKIK